MSNALLTINMITREAVRLWKNSNAFIQNIDTQYDDSFAVSGAKIGQALRIRLPNDYTVSNGPAAQTQDTAEQSTTLALATQRNVSVSFSSTEKTMSLDDYSERVMAPAVNNLAGNVASTIMEGSEGGVCNFIANLNGSTIINPVADTYLNAGAILDTNSAPTGNRKVVNDPFTQARVVSSLSGLFNPAPQISRQYATAQMQEALGFDWLKDQTVIKHTGGTFSAGGLVNGANQTGTSVLVSATTGTLNQGDFITFPGVYAVNRITKQTTGQLRQFVVTDDVPSGSTVIPIYPALIPAGVGGQPVQYQTVTVSPANAAQTALVNPAGVTFRKNIAYAPQAVTMATADLYMPTAGVIEAAREAFDGVSLRMVTQYEIGTDQVITRLDVLFGWLFIRPEWCVAIGDAV